MKCGGTFSDAEFEALEAQKTDLSKKKMEARSKLRSLAWELLAVQKEHEDLDAKLDRVHRRQEEMVDQEARALDELDLLSGVDDEFALMTDLDFSVPSLEEWSSPDGNHQSVSG